MVTILLLLNYPSSFFLVTGYSESLYLPSLLGFLYWMNKEEPHAWWIAGLHGFVLSLTRILGILLAIVPLVSLVAVWMSRKVRVTKAMAEKATLTSILAALGGLSFFLFCAQTFGRWDLYQLSQRVGWHIVPDMFAILRPSLYWVWELTINNPDTLSRFFFPLLMYAWMALIFMEMDRSLGGTTPFRERIPFYTASIVLLYYTAAALANVRMMSFLRHSLPIFVVLLLAIVHRWPQAEYKRTPWLFLCGLCVVFLFALLQSTFLVRYTHDQWVA